MAAYVDNIDASLVTGNRSYTNVGFAPEAVIFWGTKRASAGADEQGAYSGFYGMTDGTTSVSVGMAGAAPTSNAHYAFGDTSPIKLVNVSGTILAEAEIVSLDLDGFTLNWTTAAAAAYDINFLAIGGNNFAGVKVGLAAVSSTGETAFTGVGFQPDNMLLFTAQSTTHPFAGADGNNTLGIGMDDGTVRLNHCTFFRNSIIDAGNSYQSTTYSLQEMESDNAPSRTGAGVITSFDADGFTVDMTSLGGTMQIGYLAMRGADADIRSALAPGSATDQVETGAGFRPEFVFAFGTAVDGNFNETHDGGWEGAEIQIGASDGTRHRFAQFGCDVDGDGGNYQSETYLIAQAADIDAVDSMGTIADAAVLSSLDADGYTLAWDPYATSLDPVSFLWAGAGGTVLGTFDNKLIYSDQITVT